MPKNNDEAKLATLLGEIAADSMKKKESKEQYKERLEALRDVLDSHIDAALM